MHRDHLHRNRGTHLRHRGTECKCPLRHFVRRCSRIEIGADVSHQLLPTIWMLLTLACVNQGPSGISEASSCSTTLIQNVPGTPGTGGGLPEVACLIFSWRPS